MRTYTTRSAPLASRPGRSVRSRHVSVTTPFPASSGGRNSLVVVHSFRENPQNTGQPIVVPEPGFDCIAAVQAQLQSLATPNDPWPNHGTQMAYNFAYDVGGLDPSMYFAYPTDLYHLDHFMGKFANKLPDVLGNKSFDIDAATLTEPEDPEDFEATWTVEADVEGRTGTTTSRIRFSMRRKRVGTYKGCLMTYMIETL